MDLTPFLDDLEARIDESDEERLHQRWRAFWEDEIRDDVFCPPSRAPQPAGIDWPAVHINDAQNDVDLMVLSELRIVSGALASGGNGVLAVRSNYGVGILASQFGCEVMEMPREQNNLPTTIPLGTDAISAVLDAGVPDVRAALGGKVLDTAERFLELFAHYPKIKRWVALYHPDLQGPMDNAELVWGSEVFLAFYDAPEQVHAMLDLLTRQYAAFAKRWFELVPPNDELNVHWGGVQRGTLMIRNDSLMNLSPDIYTDFIRDCDQKLLDAFGGGAIHFCGRGDHFIEAMGQMRGLHGINLTQPHLNDMEKVYQHTVYRGIKLIALPEQAAYAGERPLRGQVQCNVPASSLTA